MTDKCNFITAINQALHDAMENDDSVIMLGEDIADSEGGGVVNVTKSLSSKYGERVMSTPISEEAIIGAAIGASLVGKRPIAEIMLMNFITGGMDQLVNHAAKLRYMSGGQTNVPITIRTMTGAGSGFGGQHCDMLEAWFAHTAGLKVVVPSTPADAYGLLMSCVKDNDPCIFVENMPTYWTDGLAPERGKCIPLGISKVVNSGVDITIISYGRSMVECNLACKELQENGKSVELIDLRTISPIDYRTLYESVKKTGRVLIVHEAVTPFGVGAEISSKMMENCFSYLKSPIKRIGSQFCPVPYAKNLEDIYIPTVNEIVSTASALIGYKVEL